MEANCRAAMVVALLVGVLSCEDVSIEGRKCSLPVGPSSCAQGYFCCDSPDDNICLRDGDVCLHLDAWPALPVTTSAINVRYTPKPLEDVTVWAVSQVGLDEHDEQIDALRPDLVLRAWGQWGKSGTSGSDYYNQFLEHGWDGRVSDHRVRFMGGGTATAVFDGQYPSCLGNESIDGIATRDANDVVVPHDDLNEGEKRGSLANPVFRDCLVQTAQLQLDAGIDGLHYTEVNADYLGHPDSADEGERIEGLDGAHLADFNAFLLGLFPHADFADLFHMAPDNSLRRDIPSGRIDPSRGPHNFNYRTYWQSGGRLLSDLWGHTDADRPTFGSTTFTNTATTHRYWWDVVARIRAKATEKGRSDFLITANGIFPYVDFVSYSFYDEIDQHPELFPFASNHLDGTSHAGDLFRQIREQSRLMAPRAPVVLYLDGRWQTYHYDLSPVERRDFWRIYAAEAYANGLFFAFLVKPPAVRDLHDGNGRWPKTATEDGTLALFQDLAAYYRAHATYYHRAVAVDDPSVVSTRAMVSWAVSDQASGVRRLVHVINHDYVSGTSETTGLVTHDDVALRVASARRPRTLSLASPDLPTDLSEIAFTYDDASHRVSLTLPTLTAYDVVVLDY